MPDSAAPSAPSTSSPSSSPAAPAPQAAPPPTPPTPPTPPAPYVAKRHPLLSGSLILLALGLIILGVMEFQTALDFATRLDLTFTGLLDACMDGWTWNRTYTGIYVVAIASFKSGLLYTLVLAPMVLIIRSLSLAVLKARGHVRSLTQGQG